ncbi:MAG: hypothetical protein AAGK22_29420, partial [Acidobacteriota bacterium]
LTQNSRPDEMNVRLRVWDLLTGRPQMEEWLSIRRLRDNWFPGDALFWDDDGSLRLFVDDGWDLHLWRFEPESSLTTKVAALPVGDGDRSTARFFKGSYHGGAAELRFAPGGEQVLVAVRDENDEGARSPKPLIVRESPDADDLEDTKEEASGEVENDGEWLSNLAKVTMTVWTGDLQSTIYSLPPTPAFKYSVLLFPQHVVAVGRNAETRMVLRVGGADGWAHELPHVLPQGRLGDAQLDVWTDGGRFILDLYSGELEAFGGDPQFSATKFRPLSYINADGQIRPGDDGVDRSLTALYANWGDSRDADSIVRFDVETGEEAPFFTQR